MFAVGRKPRARALDSNKAAVDAAANNGVTGMNMASGTVKWFSNAKGYGFILPDEGGEDVFAHFSAIEMDGYKTLKQGQKVEFEVNEGPKGLQASRIKTLG